MANLQSLVASMQAFDTRLQKLESTTVPASLSMSLNSTQASMQLSRSAAPHVHVVWESSTSSGLRGISLVSPILPSPECDKAISSGEKYHSNF